MLETSSRRKLLLIAPFPYGAQSGQGGATACYNALRLLASRFDIGVVVFSSTNDTDKASIKNMQALASMVITVPFSVPKSRVLKAKLTGLFTRTPEHAAYFDQASMVQAIAQAESQFRPDWVMTQFPQMAQFLPHCHTPLRIMDVQDAFSVSWFRRANIRKNWAFRVYAYRQWLNWVHHEKALYAQASEVWTLSDQDSWGLKAFSPALPARTIGLPMKPPVHQPAQAASAPSQDIGFIASFGHKPNVEALSHLITQVIPLIGARLPDARFVIAGRSPPAHLVNAAPSNVHFMGYVDDLTDFYQGCRIIVAPLLSGGGLKIKVAEAMGHGKAIVATPLAVEGMNLIPDQDVIVASTPEAFADGIVRLMTNPVLRQGLETGARAVFAQQFDEQAWLNRAEAALLKLLPT
ncbi:MAG: glycosyltransferase [Aquabacterium sp.]|nr:glycosyltransferase [Aquabacterium sp.]